MSTDVLELRQLQSEQECGTCRWFEWARNPETNRKLRKMPGTCKHGPTLAFLATWPKQWPDACLEYRLGGYHNPRPPKYLGRASWNGHSCACWAGKGELLQLTGRPDGSED